MMVVVVELALKVVWIEVAMILWQQKKDKRCGGSDLVEEEDEI